MCRRSRLSPSAASLVTRLFTVVLLLAALAAAPPVGAETIVLYGPDELPPQFPERTYSEATLPPLAHAPSMTPGSIFIIPYYEVNTIDPLAEVGLMSIRAEEAASPEIEFYPAAEDEPIYLTKTVDLAAKEMWTANLRDQIAGLPGVRNGVVTGWVGVVSTNPISVDSFQVFPTDAFATGDNAFKFADLCESWRVRFLVGGGFSGGTQVMTFALDPLGGDSESDPPTFEGEVYDEAGNLLNSFAIWTNENTRLRPASGLVAGDENFGSIDIRVLSPNGGYASATHDASGLYSVGLKGYCLDSDTSP